MSVLPTLCSLLLLIPATYAAVASGNFFNPAYPGKCYINANLIMDEGTSEPYEIECGVIHCNKKSWARIHTCNPVHIVGCTTIAETHRNAAFPKCCKRNRFCADDD